MLATWFPTTRSPGAGSFIARDVAALSRDHDVHVIHLVPPELDDGVRRSTHSGVPVTSIPIDVRTPRGLLAATRRLPQLLQGADLVHTMAAPALLPFLLRRPGIPWVHTEHWSGVANLLSSRKARLVAPLTRRAYRGPDRVVAVSARLAEAVRALRPGRVDVVGNIIDLVEADTAVTAPVFRPEAFKILGVGTVNSHKGWRLAVDAVRELRDEGLDAQLVWLGHGPESAELDALADPVAVRAPGHVSASAVRAAMREADVFVLPTRSETFSLVTIESLSAGVPVVVTGEGAHTDFIVAEAGVVVERDAAAIAEGIRSARRCDRAQVREHGRKLAQRFSEEEFRVQYEQIYREVTSR